MRDDDKLDKSVDGKIIEEHIHFESQLQYNTAIERYNCLESIVRTTNYKRPIKLKQHSNYKNNSVNAEYNQLTHLEELRNWRNSLPIYRAPKEDI